MEKKLFCLKKDNNVIIYKVTFEKTAFQNFLKHIAKEYGKIEMDVINTTFSGLMPLSYGKYESMKRICEIHELGIVDDKKERKSEEYFKSLGGTSREWSFLTDEQKALFMPVQGLREGKLRVEVDYISSAWKTFKNTFINKKVIIDPTDLIKLSNSLLAIPNQFKFSKIIDLNRGGKDWDDNTRAFLTNEEYEYYLKYAEKIINKDDLNLSLEEKEKITKNIVELLRDLNDLLNFEQIGMYPIDINIEGPLKEVFTIFNEFAKRGEDFKWFIYLENAPINVVDNSIISEHKEDILKYLDAEDNIYKQIKAADEFGSVKVKAPVFTFKKAA